MKKILYTILLVMPMGLLFHGCGKKVENSPKPVPVLSASTDPIENSSGLKLAGVGDSGMYEILAAAGGVGQIAGNSIAVGGTGNVGNYIGSGWQEWKITQVDANYYTLMNVGSGLYAQSYNYNGTEVLIQNTFTGNDAQLWKLSVISGKTYSVINKADNLAVSANGSLTTELKTFLNLPNQQWGYNVWTTDIAITRHAATPSLTDPTITTMSGSNNNPEQPAFLPTDPTLRKDKLFIMIPGTGGIPDLYSDICKTGAYNGYYAIGLAYSNSTPIEYLVGANPTDSTVENILKEYLTGQDVSPQVNITRANSFENRIIKIILYLDATYPAENWKQFLTAANDIDWSKIILAGHSQGSDHAMYISNARKLYRAGLIAGPGSFKANGAFPVWMSKPLTPTSSIYGFNSTLDKVRLWSNVRPVWATIGIPGVPTSIDIFPIVNGSHQLTTSNTSYSDSHSGTAWDGATPITSLGKPLYRPVWEYMLFK